MEGKVCNESKVQSQAARSGLVYGSYDVLLNVPGWGVAEAPQPDADGTPIVVQDNENVAPDAPQTDESDPDPGENTPDDSETLMVTQSADEDAPVETSTDYTFDGAVLYTDLPDTSTGSYMAARACRLPQVKQKSAFLPGRMTSWKKVQTVT